MNFKDYTAWGNVEADNCGTNTKHLDPEAFEKGGVEVYYKPER